MIRPSKKEPILCSSINRNTTSTRFFRRKDSTKSCLYRNNKSTLLLLLLVFVTFGSGIVHHYFFTHRVGVPIPPQILELWSGESLRENLHEIHSDGAYFYKDVISLVHKYQLTHNNKEIKAEASKTIEIAVAYCSADLSWLKKSIANNELPSESNIKITILSKCGKEDYIPKFDSISNVIKVDIIKLPNKGGCDITISHFINEYMKREIAESSANTVLIFLKDTPRITKTCHQLGRYRTFEEMLTVSSNGQFVCGIKPACDMSVFHDTRILQQFSKVNYHRHGDGTWSDNNFNSAGYKNMEDFVHREFNWTFPNEVVSEVCYGGSFAVPARQLFVNPKLKDIMTKLERILTDGPDISIVEHFSERLWASFLSKPLTHYQTDPLIPVRKAIYTKNGRYMGTLYNDTITEC